MARPDLFTVVLGSPICIIIGYAILKNESSLLLPWYWAVLGYALIVVGVAYPLLTLLLMLSPEPASEEGPELAFHHDGRVSLVLTETSTDDTDR